MNFANVSAAVCSGMTYVAVYVLGLGGDEWLKLILAEETTGWQLKNTLKTLTSIPRRQQHLIVGERLLASSDTLRGSSAEIHLTLVVSQPSCSFCGGQKKLRRCSGCNDAYYCNPVCQLFDWQRGHELACRDRELGHREESGATCEAARIILC
jgi:hypothetical protein